MVVQGTVGRIEPYGAFVDLPCGQRGLVHISQLAPHRVDKTEDIVQDGMTVYCLVMDSDENRKLRLSMRAVNQQTGELVDHDAGGTPRGVSGKLLERARQRRHAWDREATPSWRQAKDSQTHRIWARSPTPPPVAAAAAAAEKKKRQRTEESSSEGSSSSDESSSSSSSEDSYEERRRRHRQDKKRRRRRRRRRSPSTSSSSESSSSSSSEDSETDKDVEEPKKPAPLKQSTSIPLEVNDQPTIEELNEAQDFQKAFQGAHNHDSEDEDEEGPMPLMVHKDGTGGASASKAYGKALLPGEGQAIASYVQQNLRVPRRGEIGYNQTDIEKYEQSGYVMSGSRHARMNAVRIRKENQIYSAEEQRALALIQVEENQQKEAQLMQEFRTMLEARRNQKTSNNQTAK
jgi:predicted RNA-binding protein with RPS1 domain